MQVINLLKKIILVYIKKEIRICAVYGGIYILNSPIDKILVNNETNECTGLVTKEGQEYNCKTLISGIDYLPLTWLPNGGDFGTWVSRAIVITNHPLKDTEDHDALAYSIFPPGSNAGNVDFPIYIIHQSQESVACPKDQCKELYVIVYICLSFFLKIRP